MKQACFMALLLPALGHAQSSDGHDELQRGLEAFNAGHFSEAELALASARDELPRGSAEQDEVEWGLTLLDHQPQAVSSTTPVDPLVSAALELQNTRRLIFIGLVLGGGALATVGGGFSIASFGTSTDCHTASCPASARADLDQRHTFANFADALLWPGLAISALSVICLALLPVLDPAPNVHATAFCTSTGCGGALAGSF